MRVSARRLVRTALVAGLLPSLPAMLAAQQDSTVRRPFWRPPPATRATQSAAGFSAERLARIDRLMQEYVDQGRMAGAVALVLRDGRLVYERAVGWSDREAGRPMTYDAIFRIASQSKAITSVAIMILVEEGRIALTDPVSRFIPEYATTHVAVRADTGVAIVPARRPITIKDLLTHTAGISYGTEPHVAARYEAAGLGPAAGYGWYTSDKDEPICTTMARLASLPFVAHPGEAWVYGYNTDILGCVVERVSGMPFDAFVARRITQPLGMVDTHFYLPTAKRDRLAAVYAGTAEGRTVRAPNDAKGQGHYVDGPRRSFSGGAGLVSTARDYARFLQMLLNGGALDGVRILAPRTVRLMATNQVGTIYRTPGLGFGLGFEVVQTFGAGGLSAEGTFSWGGAYGSNYRVDPRDQLVMVFMIQQIPGRPDLAALFPTLVYSAMMGPAPW
jgi:CubicO group peptidase (beta-lactamase class C family)